MQAHAELIERLYTALSRRDHAEMARCYAVDATFSDPVFPALRGNDVRAMWRMLCERGTDLRITYRDIHATGDAGTAHWEAWYSFSGTGRPVHNVIDSTFTFRNGLIFQQTDSFGLYAWAKQALGPIGELFGWTSLMQRVIRRNAAAALARHAGSAAP